MGLLSHAKILSLDSQVVQLLWVPLYIYDLCLDCFQTRQEAACHRDISVNVVVETHRGIVNSVDIYITTGKLKWKKGKEENLRRKETIAVSGTNVKFIRESPAAKIKREKELII